MSSTSDRSVRGSPVARSRTTTCVGRSWLAAAAIVCLAIDPLAAQQTGLQPTGLQQTGLQPGEAFVTRFSGVTAQSAPGGAPASSINTSGVVGSIIDLRAPGQAPRGEHWIDEPQRNPVTAGRGRPGLRRRRSTMRRRPMSISAPRRPSACTCRPAPAVDARHVGPAAAVRARSTGSTPPTAIGPARVRAGHARRPPEQRRRARQYRLRPRSTSSSSSPISRPA